MFDAAASQRDPVLSDALARLAELAALDATAAGDDELCDTALALEHARRLLDAAQCHTLAELDARGVTDRCHGMRTGHWLAHHAALPTAVARTRVRTAARLRSHLGPVDDALTDGRIGFDHARVLADAANPRILAGFAEVAGHLCDAAPHSTFERWRRDVAGIAELMDVDGGHDPSGDRERNHLRLLALGDSAVLRGELTGENAIVARDALDTIADELFALHARDNGRSPDLPLPDRPALLALAFVEACRRALAVDLDRTRAPRTDATLVLTPDQIDAHDPASGPRCAGTATVADRDGTPLPRRAYPCLLCDPVIHPVVLDDRGLPLHVGRAQRYATAAQRRAMVRRDGGCTFPGCTAPPAWTDAHHVRRWEHGGGSDITNLLSLCRHHHGVAHRDGWHVELDSDGWTRWTNPAGTTFSGQRHQRGPGARAGPPGPAQCDEYTGVSCIPADARLPISERSAP